MAKYKILRNVGKAFAVDASELKEGTVAELSDADAARLVRAGLAVEIPGEPKAAPPVAVFEEKNTAIEAAAVKVSAPKLNPAGK